MLKRLLNVPECITYRRLSEVCGCHSAKVHAKIRLADVLPIEGSGISDDLYRFALQAHYDFVIADSRQRPLFAVEFDGPQHGDPAARERDAQKDALSRRFGLPLLRAAASDLCRTGNQLDQLTELAEQWFEERKMSAKLSCPVCGDRMVEKVGKYGRFLSCVRYPACQGACDLPRPPAGAASGGLKPVSFACFLSAGLAVVLMAFLTMRGSDPQRNVGEERPPVTDKPSGVTAARSAMMLHERQAYVDHLNPADYPLCPDCRKRMAARRNGETEEPFFGCSQFPACRATRSVGYPR